MDDIQKKKLQVLIKELENIRGRHTELVTVYVPAGFNLNVVVSQIKQEQSTAQNIKSKTVRKNVVGALEKILGHLRLYKATPENGVAIFCGNVSGEEGSARIKIWAIEPPETLKVRTYRCDQTFIMDPLKDIVRERELYGLIVVDKSDADIGLLRGKRIEVLKHLESLVPGKTRKGGQCLTEDSLIQLDTGEIIKIKDVHNPHTIKGINLDSLSVQDSRVVDSWRVVKNKAYRIITKSPRFEITSSGDHMFFVLEDDIREKSARNLKIGNHLLMPEKLPIDGKIEHLEYSKYYTSLKPTKAGRIFLKKKRIKKGLTQKKLGKKLKLTQTCISVIELGKRCVGRDVLRRICRALDTDFDLFASTYCESAGHKLPNRLDENLAQILGYFTGDGSYDTNKLCFYEAEQNVIEIYKQKVDRICPQNSIKFRKGKNYYILRVYSKGLVDMLKGEFPEMRDSRASLIPSKVLKSKNAVLAAFLKGIFDAEGYVSSCRVGLGISNKLLAQQIQLCLLRFGILSGLLEF